MEELQTITIQVPLHDKTIACDLKEKDFGDYIIFEVFTGDNYLFTISKSGDILFNEGAITSKQDVMEPAQLNEIADYLGNKVRMGINE